MALIKIVRDTPNPPEEAWRRITDWARHGEHVPFTTVTSTANGFNARTGIGRIAFDDPMDIVEWNPPHFCRLEKRGRVILGWAEITVTAQATGSQVSWIEEVQPRGVPRIFGRFTTWATQWLFGRVLERLLVD